MTERSDNISTGTDRAGAETGAGQQSADAGSAEEAESGPATAAADPTDVPSASRRRPERAHARARERRGRVAGAAGNPAATTTVAPPATLRPPAPAAEVLASSPDGTTTQEKADRASADWQHFAPQATVTKPVVARVASRTGVLRRFLGHEWTLAALGALVLSVLLNRGALADPAHTLPQDVWDPSLVAYLIAWGGHALVHGPASLWHLNAFFPSPYGLAYTDSLLGYAPLAVFGSGPEAAVLRYNVIFILAQALALFGAYALARQLGVGRVGAAVAGLAFAMAPWRLAQAGHLHVISTGGIALALAMLARGHGVRWRHDTSTSKESSRRRTRPAWALAGWLVATWQLTIGFGIGLVFLYVLLGLVIVGTASWLLSWLVRRRPLPPRRLLLADALGGAVFAAVAVLMAQPYLKVLELFPYARRTDDWVVLYSPPLRGFFTSPPESLLWGDLHASSRALLSVPAEMALLPGFTLYALAAGGVLFSVWSVRVRLALLAGAVGSIALGLGTQGPGDGKLGYLVLLHNLPGFEGLRTPGRLVIWTTLLLALLAAGGVCAVVRRAAQAAQHRGLPRPTAIARLALLLPLAFVLVEGLGNTPHATVPAPPSTLSTVQAPYLVLPSDQLRDMHVMLWSTDRFADVVNGGSGVVPAEQNRTREVVQSFPDPASVGYLRALGVRTVVVLPQRAGGTQWEEAANLPIDGLGITREVHPDAVVFHLSP